MPIKLALYGEDGCVEGRGRTEGAVWFLYSLLGEAWQIEVVLDIRRVKVWMIGCRSVEMWWWLGWDGAGRKNLGECVKDDMRLLGLQPEIGSVVQNYAEGLCRWGQTSNPSLALWGRQPFKNCWKLSTESVYVLRARSRPLSTRT